METKDFVQHVREALTYNEMDDMLTFQEHGILVNAFARLLKHAWEAGKAGVDEERYYGTERPVGPNVGENVR